MIDMLMSVLTGGATGILGSVLGKAFNFVDMYAWMNKIVADSRT